MENKQMAKPTPDERDFYKISFQIEVEALGPVVAVLTKMGFKDVAYELVTEVHRPFGANRQYAESARATIQRVMSDGKEHSSLELREVLRSTGRPAGNVSPTLGGLMNRKLVKRVGPGVYQLTKKGMATAGETPTAATQPSKPKPERHAADELKALFADGATHTLEEMRVLFREQGRAAGSVNAHITGLLKSGFIARINIGTYQLAAQAKTEGRKVANANAGRHAGSSATLILVDVLSNGPLKWGEIVAAFKAKGRTETAAKSAVDRCRVKKVIKNTDAGYALLETKAANDYIASAREMAAHAAKPNGGAHTAAE